MPRIDPQQLLVCLTPLLAPNGGIKSSQDVQRLASLMEKFSKKLVSKCIYIQILKCTETEFLGQFMGVGGWNLTHNWLQDGIKSCNWPFVQELLEMLLLCPVDGNRLKSNITPKLVKNLSTTSCQHQGVRVLATKLVEQWLRIAHLEKQQLTAPNGLPNGYGNHTNNDDSKLKSETIIAVQNNNLNVINTTTNNVKLESVKTDIKSDNGIEESKNSSEIAKYKISNNGGLTLQLKRTTSPSVDDKDKIKASPSSSTTSSSDKTKDKSKSSSSSDRDKDKERSSSSNSSSRKPSSSSSRSSSSKSSHRDKERSSSSSQHKSSSSSKNSSSSSRDKSKDSDKKSSSSSSRHSSSSSSSRDKERAEKRRREQEKSSQAEKDQETLNLVTASVPSAKLLKIPKRQHSDNMENKSPESGADKNKDSSKILKKSGTVDSSTAALLPPKKPSISIEVRKGDKPKTVKTFNSQFRSHGLAEEAPPPPTRKGLKKPGTTPILPLPTITLPSSSIIPTIRSLSPPPNKKIHLEKTAMDMEIQERVGGVKLIKPKPMLVESGGFMDSLFASTTAVKKEPKKRKRLTSNSKKDDQESPKIAAAPLKFYKDTLDEEEIKDETKEESEVKDDIKEESKDDIESMDDDKEPKPEARASSPKAEEIKEEEEEEIEEKKPPGPGCGPDGPPGVLTDVHKKRKRPKKLLKWRPQEELEEVRYFELDENERANVTKTFIEQKQMERCDESRNFALGRKLQGEDTMVEQTQWRALIIVDNVPDHMYGSKSRECKIQSDREKTVLMDIYLDRHSLIDSPHEPDMEHYEFLEPQIIPLEDLTGNPDAVNAFTDIPWPEPKGDSSHPTYLSDAFANIFPNMNNPHPQFIPPFLDQSKGFNPLGVNPLANFQMGAMGLDTNPQMLNKWIMPPAFLPPPLMNQNFQINRGVGMSNQINNNGNNNNNNNNNNFQRNRGNDRNDRNDRNGGNWVRGNANNNGNGRWRGSCKQYAQKGYCSNGDRCIYSHSPKY